MRALGRKPGKVGEGVGLWVGSQGRWVRASDRKPGKVGEGSGQETREGG